MLEASMSFDVIFNQVKAEINDIISEKKVEVPAIDEEIRLADLGISSLDLAELISNLETVFGIDPFEEHVVITEIVNVQDLCNAYLAVTLKNENKEDELDGELKAILANSEK